MVSSVSRMNSEIYVGRLQRKAVLEGIEAKLLKIN